MRKFMKKLSLVMAFVVCISLGIPAFINSSVFAFANMNAIIEGVQIAEFESTAVKGQTYTIAQSSVSGVTTTVKDPWGRNVTVSENTFVPTYKGTYTITYTYNDTATDMYVNVQNVAEGYEIAFEQNSKFFFPKVVNPTNGTSATQITLPNAYVVDADGEKVDSAEVVVSATFSGTNTDWSLTADAYTDTASNIKYDVLTMDKSAPNKETYTLTYKYLVSNSLLAYKTVSITSDANYNNDYDVSYTLSALAPTSAQIGIETKLPSVIPTNTTTKKEINVYYNITAEYIDGTTTKSYTVNDTDNEVITFKDGNFFFTPALDGDYTFTYEVKDFFDNTVINTTSTFKIEDVGDNTKPNPIVVMPYTDADKVDGILTDYEIALNQLVTKTSDENILIFPIYATDNANSYVDNNLTLKRVLSTNSGKTIYTESSMDTNGKILVFNSTLGDISALADTDELPIELIDANGKTVKIKKGQVEIISDVTLNNDDYKIKYTATDKAGNTKTSTYYINVTDTFKDEIAPEVEFAENLPSAIFLNEKVEFATPTATDDVDSRTSVYLSYKITIGGVEGEAINVSDTTSLITFNKDTNKYEFTIEDNTIEAIEITAHCTDLSGNTGDISKKIVILNSGDSKKTAFVSKEIPFSFYTQGEKITLPSVTYEDDLVDYVNLEIRIELDNTSFTAMDVKAIKNYTLNSNNCQTIVFKDATFIATLAGEYTITYITTDAANNKTITVFNCLIEENVDNIEPKFIELPTEIANGSMERGETIDLPIASIDLNNSNILAVENDKYSIIVNGPVDYVLDSIYSFTPNAVGDYTIIYTANIVYAVDYESYYAGDLFETITSKEFKISVKDETDPVINNLSELNEFFDSLNEQKIQINNIDNIITLELATTNDAIDFEKSYVSIRSNTETETFYYNNIASLEDFVFDQDYAYEITYCLVDAFNPDNKTTETFTLNIGDVFAPVIKIDGILLNETYKIGDTISIDLSKITAKDAVDGDILNFNSTTSKYYVENGATMNITVKNTTTSTTLSNNSSSSNSNLKYEYSITAAGTYEVIIAISDTKGNVATYDTIEFTVASAENAGASAEEILGIVLIIISVLLLGGVIAYFIITRKNLAKKYK